MPTALIPETTATTTTQDSDAVLPATTRHSPEAKPPHEPLEGRTLGEPVVRRALGVIPAMAHLALGAVVCCLSFATSTTASFTDTLAGSGPRFTRRPITSQARVRSGSEAERAEQRLRDALNLSQNEPSPKRSRSPSLPRLVQRTATVAVKQLVRATGASFLGASADTLTESASSVVTFVECPRMVLSACLPRLRENSLQLRAQVASQRLLRCAARVVGVTAIGFSWATVRSATG